MPWPPCASAIRHAARQVRSAAYKQPVSASQFLGQRGPQHSMARLHEHGVERAWDATQVKCVHQQGPVANLAPGPRTHEPPQWAWQSLAR